MLWYPSGYCDRYGAQWCAPPYDGPPHYPALPIVWVVDLAVKGFGLRRRRFWKKARDQALLDWQASGLLLPVTADASRAYESGCITLAATPTPDGTAGYAAFGLTPEDAVRWPDAPHEAPLPGVGWAHVDDTFAEQQWLARSLGALRKVIGHEVGHTFGFGHNPGTGVMDVKTNTTTRVSLEETRALNTYFFGGGQ